jgi:O-antigen ligase
MTSLYVTIPGLIETLAQLFTGISNDSSAQSRTGSYALAAEFISRSPVYGRGFATFLPKYRILDNQYLGLLIEVGVAGCLAMLILLLTAILCSRAVAVTATSANDRMVAQGLTASVCAAGVGLAFYDGLGFPMAAGMLFLILGLAGAQWRLTRRRQRYPHERRSARSLSGSRDTGSNNREEVSRTTTRAFRHEDTSKEPVVGRRGENHVSA